MNRSMKDFWLLPRRNLRAAICAATLAALIPTAASAAASCDLHSARGNIKHVIYVQFDNTHFRRDNPNVPSDLEQMPHLLHFIEGSGTLMTNDHTVLIAHTAGGILSTLTGVYPDRDGITVSNSYVRTSDTGRFSYPSAFGYWTDDVSAANTATVPNLITPDGANVPAPWVAFTRAGCNVGAVGAANTVLENTGTGATGDITKVFGQGSPQWTEAQASNSAPYGSAERAKAQTDFVGLAIHCAQGSDVCAGGQNDVLPDEPGGYHGFKGLFGAQEIDPVLTGSATVTDLLGNAITDPFGQAGFPGFDGMSAAVSLAYVAEMQEHGVPVTFAYISDAHDFHGSAGNAHRAYGPGEAGYVQQLKNYDDAFAAFFQNLADHGITRDNTLFVFTVDEGDHFVGVQKSGCDGVDTPCTYEPGEIGEINTNIDKLIDGQFPTLASQFLGSPAANTFTVHGDSAPTFYLAAKGSGALAQDDPQTRGFERSAAALTAVNPYTGASDDLMVRMADHAGMQALHMFAAADPARNPSFVLFADPNYYITDYPSSTCETCINPAYAWNHGDIQHQIAQTWIGLVGPGVRRLGTSNVWSDHTDVRPTMLALLGLHDDYVHDGRVLIDPLQRWALPRPLRVDGRMVRELGAIYKQLNAPFGRFGRDILTASTAALRSGGDGHDRRYTAVEARIRSLTARRDALADRIKTALDGAAFDDEFVAPRAALALIGRAEMVLWQAHVLAHHS